MTAPGRNDKRREAAKRGAMLRDAGILRADTKKQNRDTAGLLRAELRFLDALLAKGSASVDDVVDDLDTKHGDGGHWLGGIFLRLSRGRLIVEAGSVRSCRPARHRGRLILWGIGNREAVEQRQRDVRRMLAALTADADLPSGGAVARSPEPTIDPAGATETQRTLFGVEN